MAAKTSIPRWAKGLDEREALFVREFLKDLSKTEAYLRLPAVTENRASASELGHRMSERPHVAAAIEQAMHDDGAGPRLWLTTKLVNFANANLADFIEWRDSGEPGGEPVAMMRPWKDMPRELTACVSEIVKRKDGSVRYKLHDPIRAVEILAKVGAIRLTQEHVVVDDSSTANLTPDIELARRVAFLLQKVAARTKGTST